MIDVPKVAVLVACFNHEKYIVECLESIVNQNYSNIEIWLADDCSTDGSVKIINNYLLSVDKVNINFLVNKKNKGIANNYNQLIDLALENEDVEYVIPFAGDDVMRADKISKQVEVLESNRECYLCYSNMMWFNSETGKKIINHFNLLFRSSCEIETIISEAIIPTPTLCIRRRGLNKIRFNNNIKYINDYLFAVELAIFGGGVAYIPETLVFYRKHGNSIMDTRTFSNERLEASSFIRDNYGYIKSTKKFEKTAKYDELIECLYQKDYKQFSIKMFLLLPWFFSSIKWFFRFLKVFHIFFRNR